MTPSEEFNYGINNFEDVEQVAKTLLATIQRLEARIWWLEFRQTKDWISCVECLGTGKGYYGPCRTCGGRGHLTQREKDGHFNE